MTHAPPYRPAQPAQPSQALQHAPASPRRHRRVRLAAGVAALAVALTGLATATAGAASAIADDRICGKFDVAAVDGGRHTVQNNRWGTAATQCITARDGGFTLGRADGAVGPGAPKSYPSILTGCHWGRCTTASPLPLKVSGSAGLRSSVTTTRAPGQWNAAYDIWVDSRKAFAGQADDTEIMVWTDHQGALAYPLGSRKGSFTSPDGAAWDVFEGNIGWDVVSFVRQSTTRKVVDLDLGSFVAESVRRGATERGSWITSVQYGFEPWAQGTGLSVSGFDVRADGNASRPEPGPAPRPTPTPAPAPSPAPSRPAQPDASAAAIQGKASGRCVDVAGRSTANAAPLQLWDCQEGNEAQAFERRGGQVVGVGSGRCLDVSRSGRVQTWTCRDSDGSQRWTTRGDALVHDASGKCLSARSGAGANGTRLVVERCDGAPGQRWDVRR